MEYYCYLTLREFVAGLQSVKEGLFGWGASDVMRTLPMDCEPRGLAIFREALHLYERQHRIDPSLSKADMPLFRNNSRWLVGPEYAMFFVPFYEKPVDAPDDDRMIRLTIDHAALVGSCLDRSYGFSQCIYDHDRILKKVSDDLEAEYDRFHYADGQIGFSPRSQLFSILSGLCMQVAEQPDDAGQWRLTALSQPEEILFHVTDRTIESYIMIYLSVDAIREVTLRNETQRPDLYGNLIALMQKYGLSPFRYLHGFD